MTNLSKAVTDRLKVSRSIIHALELRGEQVAEESAKILFPDGVPEQVSPAAFVDALRGALVRVSTALEQADRAHASELADDPGYRDARDEASSELTELLQRIRGALTGAYGRAVLVKVGLQASLPRDGQKLVQRARHVAEQLDEQILGAPSDDLLAIDPKHLRKRLIKAATALEAGLGDVERERREAEQTLEERDLARDAWGRIYGGVADAFVAFASLAGLEELAEHVKPTKRRRAGRPEPADEVELDVEEGTGAADAPADAGEAPQPGE